jgi:hypothetical protein
MTVIDDTIAISDYRLATDEDVEKEYIDAVDHRDVAICGAWRLRGHSGWIGYVSEDVKRRTRVRTSGYAHFTSRGTAVNWVAMIANLYTRAVTS